MKWSPLLWLVFSAIAVDRSLAAPLEQARVSQVVDDVKLLPQQAPPKPAAISDVVKNGTAVRTGVGSRAELTFTDQTLARLGANTLFSFSEGTRNLELGEGAMLLRVPKNAGGAKINTAAVTAAITGTTVMLDYHKDSYVKFIVMEGTGLVSSKIQPGPPVPIHAGQMILMKPGDPVPEAIDIDLDRLRRTSRLLSGDFPPLLSIPLIDQAVQEQLAQKESGELVETDQIIFGRGTNMSLGDPFGDSVISQKTVAASDEASPTPPPAPTTPPPAPTTPPPAPTTPPPAPTTPPPAPTTPPPAPTTPPPAPTTPPPAPTTPPPAPTTPPPAPTTPPPAPTTPPPAPTTPPPAPTPAKFGTPIPIASPNPYLLTGGSQISTDPAITTAGVTAYGKIYRSSALDGPPSAFLFGSTAAFDSSTGFDTKLSALGNVPFAVFEFNALTITGNPAISTANAGAPGLGLGAFSGITTAGPGGVFDLSGLNNFFLATANDGSALTLGSELSFTGGNDVLFYARGVGSNLAVASAVNSPSASVTFLAGNNISASAPVTATNFVANAGTDFATSAGALLKASTVNVIAGSVATLDPAAFDLSATSSFAVAAGTIKALANFQFPKATIADFSAGAGGITANDLLGVHNLTTPGDINAGSIVANQIITTNGGSLNPRGAVFANSISISGDINASGIDVHSAGDFVVDGFGQGATWFAGGNINAGFIAVDTSVQAIGSITTQGLQAPQTLTAGGALNVTNATILYQNAGVPHTITAASVSAPFGIFFNGAALSSDPLQRAGQSLELTTGAATFGTGAGAINEAHFDGADGSTAQSSPAGANGGIFIVNASGAIDVNVPLTATTGRNEMGTSFGGAGGAISLISSGGAVSVNSILQVSSNDPVGTTPGSESANGGKIILRSGLTSGAAITLSGGAQLLSLLNPGAPGPGGQINVSTSGGDITSNGTITADRGLITLQNPGGATTSQIVLDGGSITSENFSAISSGDIDLGLTNPVALDAVSIFLRAGNDLKWIGADLQKVPVNSAGNVTLRAGRNIAITNGLRIYRFVPTSHPQTTGNNIAITTDTGNFTVGGAADLQAESTNLTGGNIALNIAGSVAVTGQLQILPFAGPGATPSSGSNATVTTGGPFSAGELFVTGGFGSGANVSSGANISLNLGGDFTITNAAGGGANIALSNRNSGAIGTGGNLSFLVTGNVSLPTMSSGAGFLALNIANHGFSTISSGGDLIASISGKVDANRLSVGLTNYDSSSISTGGNVTFGVGSDLTTQANAAFTLDNSAAGQISTGGNLTVTAGGNIDIGTNLVLSVTNYGSGTTARSTVSTGGNLSLSASGNLAGVNIVPLIDNHGGGRGHPVGGIISTGGNLTVNINGSITTPATGSFTPFINNSGDGTAGTGGLISNGGNLQVTAGSISVGNLSLTLNNSGLGNISTGGNINLSVAGALSANTINVSTDNTNAHISSGGNVTANVGGTLTTTGDASFLLINKSGGLIDATANVSLWANAISVGGSLHAYIDNVGGSVGVGGGAGGVFVHSNGGLTVTNTLHVYGLLDAVGDIDVGTLASNSVVTPANVIVGAGGIIAFSVPGEPVLNIPHQIDAANISSVGGINFNGQDSSPTVPATNAGVLSISANTILFEQSNSVAIQGPVTLNGGNDTAGFGAGSGGNFLAHATNALTVNSSIEATTGQQDPAAIPSGQGGSVVLTSDNGLVAINSSIQVSSNETPAGSPAPIRVSDAGGSITLQSRVRSGPAINVSSSASLLAPLNPSATGAGGIIQVVASGGDIFSAGVLTADRGVIQIDNSIDGVNGSLVQIESGILTADSITISSAGTLQIDAVAASGPTINANTLVLAGNHVQFGSIPQNFTIQTSYMINAGLLGVASAGVIGAPSLTNRPQINSQGSVSASGDIFAADINVTGAASDLTSMGGITVGGGSVRAGRDISVANALNLEVVNGTFGNVTAGGNIVASGGIFTPGNPEVVTAGGFISAPAVITGTLAAGTDITIDNTAGSFSLGIIANTITAGGTLFLKNAPFISPNNAGSNSSVGSTFDPFTLTVGSIASTGSTIPALSSNGGNVGSNDPNPGNGGSIGVTLTAGRLDVGNGGELASITANGGAFGTGTTGGDGGTITVAAPGPITVNSFVVATSGLIDATAPPAGAGGSVSLTSDDTLTVNGTVQVSHADPAVATPTPTPTPAPRRASRSGGSIRLHSNKTTGVAINVSSSGQLLSLLSGAAPGPGGSITIVAGKPGDVSSSQVNVSGTVTAQPAASPGPGSSGRGGVVDIRHNGDNGVVNLNGATIRGDVIKVGALGTNGSLNVSGGSLNADTTLKLFAGGSNGTVNFLANATLSGSSAKTIYGNTVNVNNGVTVTVNGPIADVYTNNANYSSFSGGNNSKTGTFVTPGPSPAPGATTHLNQLPPGGF